MHKAQSQVREFMLTFNQECRDAPTIPPETERRTRAALIHEECVSELCSSLELDKPEDLYCVADGLVDSLYVIYGTAEAYGIDLEPLFNYVHAKNMRKLWTAGELDEVPPGAISTPSAGLYIVTLNGKILKPPGFIAPNLNPLLEQQKL